MYCLSILQPAQLEKSAQFSHQNRRHGVASPHLHSQTASYIPLAPQGRLHPSHLPASKPLLALPRVHLDHDRLVRPLGPAELRDLAGGDARDADAAAGAEVAGREALLQEGLAAVVLEGELEARGGEDGVVPVPAGAGLRHAERDGHVGDGVRGGREGLGCELVGGHLCV